MPLPLSDYASLIEPTWLTIFTSIESPWLAIISPVLFYSLSLWERVRVRGAFRY